MLALSGQVSSKVKGRGAFQDVDHEGAFSDVAAFSEAVHSGSNHAGSTRSVSSTQRSPQLLPTTVQRSPQLLPTMVQRSSK